MIYLDYLQISWCCCKESSVKGFGDSSERKACQNFKRDIGEVERMLNILIKLLENKVAISKNFVNSIKSKLLDWAPSEHSIKKDFETIKNYQAQN